MIKTNNTFSLAYYSDIINTAKNAGYKFVTLREFFYLGCPEKRHFILRHDLDKKPQTMQKILDIEILHDVRSTIFVRTTANEYNVLSYPVMNLLKNASEQNFEIGCHTSFVEYALINNLHPMEVLELEYEILTKFFDVCGLAPHRDLNYAYNSLPFIEKNWAAIKDLGFEYQAYDQSMLKKVQYINEGFNPHLCWRDKTPEDIILSGQSICMLTHNHWWYENNPFEE